MSTFLTGRSMLGDIRFRSFAVNWQPSDNELAMPATTPTMALQRSVIASPDKS